MCNESYNWPLSLSFLLPILQRIRTFNFSKQRCSSSLKAFFKKFLFFLLPQIHSFFGNRLKSHRARYGKYGGLLNIWMWLFDKNFLRDRTFWISTLQNPCIVIPPIWPFLPKSFPKVNEGFFVLFLISGLTIRFPFSHNNTLHIKKNFLHFYLAH